MSRKSGDDAALGCVVQMLLIVFLMPIVGLGFALSKNGDDESRALGWVLFGVGIVVWIVMAIIKAG